MSRILQALQSNRNWFLNSGVLSADNGFWGVAERVFLTEGNEATGLAMDSFPSWTEFPGGVIIEQRRADCNFQVAWYFLQLAEIFDKERNTAVAENLLEYLYNRSGLLSHNKIDEPYPRGCWNWSHIRWTPSVYFDDNAWCIILALNIAARRPDLDLRFQMRSYALDGARALYQAFIANFPEENKDYQPHWNGNLLLPHWGALAVAALSYARSLATAEEQILWDKSIRQYFDFVESKLTEWNASELCYSLMTISLCRKQPDFENEFLPLARKISQTLQNKMAPGTCLLPAEHYEAPAGAQLADLIYTMNFAAVAFSQFCQVDSSQNSKDIFKQITDLLMSIQDTSADVKFNGCWRGMYDVASAKWGGGNHSEGGADSIYTGWTNAPIGWTIAQLYTGKSCL